MIESVAEKSWLALYTKPRHELKAKLELDTIEIHNYLPLITKVKQWSDRKKKVTEPIIRSYIFIYASEKERLQALECKSVIRCLFERGKPAKIPAWQIESLRQMIESKYDLMIVNGIVPGARIRITSGPFQGVTGVVQEVSGEKNISVSLELLNRTVYAKIPDNSIIEIIKND